MARAAWVLAAVVVLVVIGDVQAGRDFYQILGLSRDASEKQIKKAFRTLSVKFHPDKNPGNKEAEEKYIDINTAYEVLSDPEKRRQYDQLGEDGMKEAARGGGGGGFGGFDPFAEFFGFGRRSQQRNQGLRDGESFEVEIPVSLEDVYNGKELRFLHRKQTLCHRCRGSGTHRPEDVVKCSECGGTGTKTVTKRLGPGFVQQMQTTCNKCGGKGTISKSKCPHCHGTKVEMGAVDHFLLIEKGMPEGHKIVYRSAWEEVPETNPGDLTFILKTVPHPVFVRNGNDLNMKMEISLMESLLGFSKQFTHLDNRIVTVTREEVTIPGQVIMVKDEGMPHHEYPSFKGNLYIEFSIKFPESLTSAQKQGLKNLFQV
jgi:DnaJ-related protein SCJ1